MTGVSLRRRRARARARDSRDAQETRKPVSKASPTLTSVSAARQRQLAESVYSTAWSPMGSCSTRRSSATRRSSGARSELDSAGKHGLTRCRIPQRLQNGTKNPSNSISIPRARSGNAESTARPKSANRLKEELYQNRTRYASPRPVKPAERVPPVLKRPSALSRKAAQRPVITVPVTQIKGPPTKTVQKTPFSLTQVASKRDVDVELERSQASLMPTFDHQSDRESIASRGEKLTELKIIWQDKIIQFEHMKDDLKEIQKNILSLYAKMRETHQKMSALGERADLPPAEDLRIMNVSNMTPEQLLQLCAGDDSREQGRWTDLKTPETIDLNKLYVMPSKLVDTCEETLIKRKEIIDWFESLKSQEKGISVHKLSKKINEFNAENDMLKCSLENSKTEFHKELEQIVVFMRKNVNETMALQLRIEELTLEMSELNSQNTDLRKQLHNADHIRSQINRNRVEELERELKEEKCKRLFMRDRLSRSEGQVKIHVERAIQLEATLEQARSQNWSLERTVQQLHDQNLKLQSDFDKELCKLTESIREHTVHLEDIGDAREKLQTEKEDLEKRLTELSAYYNESLHNNKIEMASGVAKLIEAEKKYEEQSEEKKNLEMKLEVLCTQLLEAELRHKNVLQQLQEKEDLINKGMEALNELETTKHKLEEANLIISDNNNCMTKQKEKITEYELNLKEAEASTAALKSELSTKNEYIDALDNKNSQLAQQLQENEHKMEAYVEQLSTLKENINQLQDDFGEFENLNELHEMLNKQRVKLLESTRQNGELAEALQKKDKELDQYHESLAEHEQLLLQREDVIKMLSEKEEEQSNIIKILRNNLELRSQTDNDLNQQVMEKNTEIDSLLVNLETRKQQISNMEKIILTLEDQTRKASLQRKKDQDHLMSLQKRVAEYETMHQKATRNINSPENLDSLIKILEDELEASTEHELGSKDPNFNHNIISQRKGHGDRKRDKLEYRENNLFRTRYQSESDDFPTKIVMGNYAKKIFDDGSEEQYIGENFGKKAINNYEPQRWVSKPEHGFNMHAVAEAKDNVKRLIPNPPQNTLFSRNLQYLNTDQQKGDKRHKMFKFAGHRL